NTTTDEPYKGNSVSHAFERAVRQAGIKDFRFHDTRHTFASRLVQSGVPLNTVRELLGHKSMAMTMIYSPLAPSNLRDAVNLLNRGTPGAPDAKAQASSQ
ncbi:MAG: tyrosine-type recombinase/integrase, partial [Planctomycetota bacterium]